MVTAELAVAILAALIVLVALCWGIFLVVLQLRLTDTAGEVARQAARGDREAVARARNASPPGVVITVRVDGRLTRVEVAASSRPVRGLPAVDLHAVAQTATEPGVVAR